jgi:hypothetical protein
MPILLNRKHFATLTLGSPALSRHGIPVQSRIGASANNLQPQELMLAVDPARDTSLPAS